MASFDISRLFTNVALQESIDLCIALLFNEHDTISYEGSTFNKEQFSKLLTFATKENHFIFNGVLYDKIDGLAMSSPLGPTLANIFLGALETKFLQEYPSSFKPLLYHKYVDDTFFLFENFSHVQYFLDFINQQTPNIKFKSEVESENSLPFLDARVMLDGSGFATSLYRKKTFTGLYNHFSSLSPIKYKINLINSLLYRAFHICST